MMYFEKHYDINVCYKNRSTSWQLSKTFLLKSYFLRSPLPMLIVIYLFNVIAVGYIIYALERAYGTCMEYNDVIWMMASCSEIYLFENIFFYVTHLGYMLRAREIFWLRILLQSTRSVRNQIIIYYFI